MAVVSSTRLVGLDLARLVALLGMVVAHLLTGVVDGRVTLTHQLVAGRSSGLFALLAGLTIVLLARTREPVRGPAWRAEQAASAARAVGLGVLGLLLGGLVDTGMSVILTYYAVLFVLATPFLALRTRWIALAAGLLLLVGPPLSQVVRSVLTRDAPSDPTPASLLDPLGLLQELERSVARPGGPADLELILSRGFKAVVPTDTWAWLLVRAPHSGTWLDQVNVIGSSCLVIGVCLFLGRRVPGRFVVLTGAGSLTLTLYTLHVVSRDRGLVPVDGADQLVPQVAIMIALGVLAHRLGRRGPLEAVLARMSLAARASVAAGASPARTPRHGAGAGPATGGQPEPSLQ